MGKGQWCLFGYKSLNGLIVPQQVKCQRSRWFPLYGLVSQGHMMQVTCSWSHRSCSHGHMAWERIGKQGIDLQQTLFVTLHRCDKYRSPSKFQGEDSHPNSNLSSNPCGQPYWGRMPTTLVPDDAWMTPPSQHERWPLQTCKYCKQSNRWQINLTWRHSPRQV